MVLACTHYPFLANVLRRMALWPVDWFDPAESIAPRMLLLLVAGKDKSLHHHEDIAVFTSGKPDYAILRLLQGFGLQFNQAE